MSSRQSSRKESANRRGTIRTTDGFAVYGSEWQWKHTDAGDVGVELRKRSEVERTRGVSDGEELEASEGVLTGRGDSFGRNMPIVGFDFVAIFLRRTLVGTREEGTRIGSAFFESSSVTDN